MTDLIILSTLLAGPKHGYQLKHEAGLILGQGVLHDNLVYPLLRRFMEMKWVSRQKVPGERGQTRHQYSLTPLGHKELLSRLSSFSERDATSSDAFRLRVGLFSLLEPDVRERILTAREKFLRTRTEQMNSIRKSFELDVYPLEVTSQYLTEVKSELAWIARLRKLANTSSD